MLSTVATTVTEQELMKRIQVALSGAGCRAFRTNVGQGWTGSKVIRHADGSVTILDARPFNSGLPKGFPDLLVVADGGKVTFLEIKTPGGDYPRNRYTSPTQYDRWAHRSRWHEGNWRR